jgi:hypothetical protein
LVLFVERFQERDIQLVGYFFGLVGGVGRFGELVDVVTGFVLKK